MGSSFKPPTAFAHFLANRTSQPVTQTAFFKPARSISSFRDLNTWLVEILPIQCCFGDAPGLLDLWLVKHEKLQSGAPLVSSEPALGAARSQRESYVGRGFSAADLHVPRANCRIIPATLQGAGDYPERPCPAFPFLANDWMESICLAPLEKREEWGSASPLLWLSLS